MFNSRTLETAIGLIFVFLLFSTICASIREGIEAWMKIRATYLERGLRELLNDASGKGLSRTLYEHPLIFGLYRGEYVSKDASGVEKRSKNLPSYIPSKSFALALMDIVARGPATGPVTAAGSTGATVPSALNSVPASLRGNPITMENLRSGVQNLENEPIARAVLSALDIAQGDLDRARLNIEQWYDGTMDRVSGWYRRLTHWWVFLISLSLAVFLNVNTISIASYLYGNDIARQHFIERVDAQTGTVMLVPAATETAGTPSKSPLLDSSLEIPIGWNHMNRPEHSAPAIEVFTFWSLLCVGWLVTAFAATLGAPFWFDVMNKIMIIRSTVKPNEKSPEEASEDRQIPAMSARFASSPQAFVTTPPRGNVERRAPAQLAYDDRSDVDGCGQTADSQTEDKDLPSAQGGMQ